MRRCLYRHDSGPLQEQFIELCKTLYNMFSEDSQEQELYHAIATVASLLLRIGEVGKRFSHRTSDQKILKGSLEDEEESEVEETPLLQPLEIPQDPEADTTGDPQAKAGGDSHMHKTPLESQVVGEGGSGEGPGGASPLWDEDTKDDLSVSSFSVVSASSLPCDDLAEEMVLVVGDQGAQVAAGMARAEGTVDAAVRAEATMDTEVRDKGTMDTAVKAEAAVDATVRAEGTVDADWCISFEQILASVLTEPALVTFFEKRVELGAKIRDQKKVERQLSTCSDPLEQCSGSV